MRFTHRLIVLGSMVSVLGLGGVASFAFAEESPSKAAVAAPAPATSEKADTPTEHCTRHGKHVSKKECEKNCPDCKKEGCTKCAHCKGEKDCKKCKKCHDKDEKEDAAKPAQS